MTNSIALQEKYRRFRFIALASWSVTTALLALTIGNVALAVAPYLPTDRAIKDEQGRIEVIVDFLDDAHLAYAGKPSLTDLPPKDRFVHLLQTVLLVEAFERSYGFKRTGMTSWVGNSVTAFLTAAQIERLRGDKAVKQLSENALHKFSTGLPPNGWGNSNIGNEWKSWGHQTVSGDGPVRNAGNSSRVVYVIDSGVADHVDFNMHPLFPRVNVACGNTGYCDTTGSASDQAQYPVVGCYAHATHVAGIIGAKENGVGTVGIYAGVKMRSVAVTRATDDYRYGAGSPLGATSPNPQDPNHVTTGWCANLTSGQSAPSSATIGYAFDWIYNRILSDNASVAIVNMSINTGAVGYAKDAFGVYTTEPNNPKIKRLATPAFDGWGRYYAGAFIAQSAGNKFVNACRNCDGGGQYSASCLCSDPSCAHGASQAYQTSQAPNSTDPSDGIMVVGAHHHTGAAVTYSLPFSDSYPAGIVAGDGSSNYGACVDAWAPGNAIVSAWGVQRLLTKDDSAPQIQSGPHTVVGSLYAGNVNQPNNTTGWLFLSGTSMAAPHVAGAAAYLADAYDLSTPAQIEQTIRSFLYSYGSDSVNLPVKTVQLP